MYYGSFDGREDVLREFGISTFAGEVVHAQYDQDMYEGSAFVIYVHEGMFYLVQGSHCSCFGLEDQWSPEEMTAEALIHMIREGRVYGISKNEDLVKRITEAAKRA